MIETGKIEIRKPEDIHQARGEIDRGTFRGRWHFSFDQYYDPKHTRFGTLRVLNDDTLSPGATWPLHPHRNIEVVTYCAEGEFLHADEHGKGHILHKGWVQHTTVGRGMYHSEINHRRDAPMRFIQMWFVPSTPDLKPSVEVKKVEKAERKNRLLPLVAEDRPGALPIASDARVFSSFLQKGRAIEISMTAGRGAYVYVLEGGPITINDEKIPTLGAAQVTDEPNIRLRAEEDAELLFIDVRLS
jgi:quercetin 2,3-dioxygenase